MYKQKEFISIKNSNLLKIIFIILITATLFISEGCSKNDHYEQGMAFIRNRQYTEAISEFQKVEAGRKKFQFSRI